MKLQTAKCTTCGASLKLEVDKAISECSYCKSQIIVSNALDFNKVKLDRSEDIKKYRENLAKFVKNNSLDEIIRTSNNIKDIIPNDFVANYYFAYAKQQKNEPKFMYEFLDKPLEYTGDDLDLVIDHLISNSDLRDENRVVRFLKAVSEEALASYRIELSKRLEIEDNYADIPRDIFICHSSKNESAVKQVVKVLEDDSNSCWISYRNLKPNDVENYWSNIEKAIINSSLILVISSEEAMRSKDVSKELELAQKYKKRLIEYKIDNKPHNSLYSHIFDGVKWVEGTSRKGLNDLKTRIFEEKKLIKDKKNPTSYVNTDKTNSKLGLIIGGLLLSISVVVGVVVFNNQSALSTSDLIGFEKTSNPDFIDYSIIYYLFDGIVSADTVTKFNQKNLPLTLPVPIKSFHTFAGWFENQDYSGELVTKILKGTNEDKSFYAKWLVNTDDRILASSLGFSHSALISSNGKIFTWGDNWSGVLGNEKNSNAKYPKSQKN